MIGWLDLFGVDADRPYTRIDGLGLVPALDGCKIVALSAEGAILETPGGVRQSYRRKAGQPGRVLVWKLGSDRGLAGGRILAVWSNGLERAEGVAPRLAGGTRQRPTAARAGCD